MTNKKLMIVGYGRHGKDTVCEYLQELGYSFQSSSWTCAEEVLFPLLKDKYGYETVEECYEDRHNHRDEWFQAIKEFNTPDLTRLARIIYDKHDVYCGVRNMDEYMAIKDAGLFDVSIWVDRGDHLPAEDHRSMNIPEFYADHVLDNNGSLDDLYLNLRELLNKIG